MVHGLVDVDRWDTDNVPIVDLHGSSYEIGHTHGVLLRRQILSQLTIYQEIFQKVCKFDWDHVRSEAAEFQPAIEELAPHLLHEMRGIVDGVNAPALDGEAAGKSRMIDLLDVIALNARSEIALGKFDDGCTSLAWDLTGGAGPPKRVLAQNWDWRTAVGPNLALGSIKQEGKPDIWMVMEPGIVGKIGFNSASVGVCLNAIRVRLTDARMLPVHILLRLLVEQSSLSDALALMERLRGCASSQHILIASHAGSRGLEVSPAGTVSLHEDELGLIVHTNHFIANKLVDERPWLEGSPIRLDRAHTLCEEMLRAHPKDVLREKLSPALLRAKVFADTFNSPQAICCIPDPTRAESVETLFNIVMVFEEGKPPRAEVLFGRSTRSEGKVYNMPW